MYSLGTHHYQPFGSYFCLIEDSSYNNTDCDHQMMKTCR
jgi:hypothetical protein